MNAAEQDPEEFDRQVRLALYRFFVDEGRAPVAAELAEVVGVRPLAVERSLHRLHDAHVIVLAPGTPYVWMANPLSALPTPYRVQAANRGFWGNCIWDALGILAMLHADGQVTCPCPDCGERLRVEVHGGELTANDALVHYAVPAAQWWDDIGFN